MSEWTHKDGVDGIKKQAQELIEQAYQRGYKAGVESCVADVNQACKMSKNDGITEGRNEAWEAAKEICKNSLPECGEILLGNKNSFRTRNSIFEKFSASEAIAKIKAYEEQTKQEEIHVGDEVCYKDKPHVKFVVTKTEDTGNTGYTLNGFSINGEQFCDKDASRWTKTGRHFDEIVEVLKKMKEGE